MQGSTFCQDSSLKVCSEKMSFFMEVNTWFPAVMINLDN